MREVCETCRALPWNKGAQVRCICHGFNLDVGCGKNRQAGFLGMDKRSLPSVDFIWDIENLPWPFPSDCVDKLLASHVLEHLKPWITFDVWNEMHRVIKENCQALIVVPHGQSYGFLQDFSHITSYVDATFAYFCPADPSRLYTIYEPKPWRLERLHSSPLHNIEAILSPIKDNHHGLPPHPRKPSRKRSPH